MLIRRRLTTSAIAIGLLCTPASAAASTPGALTPLAGPARCLALVYEHPSCTVIRGVGRYGFEASGRLSPDGRQLYAGGAGGLFVFRRRAGGALVQLAGRDGCIGSGARGCSDARGMLGGSPAVTVSPDGASVYLMLGGKPWVILAFGRDARSGRVTQLAGRRGCITVATTTTCAHIDSPNAYAYELELSPDGRFAYLSTAGRTVAFARDAPTGALRPAPGAAGCVNAGGRHGCTPAHADFDPAQGVEFSPDGAIAYIGSDVFARDPQSGRLTQLPGSATCPFVPGMAPPCLPELLQQAYAWHRSPDGRFGYAVGFNGVSTLQADPTTHLLGRPPQAGPCLGDSHLCTPLRGVHAPRDIAFSADGRSAYLTPGGTDPGALIALDRDVATGTLRQLTGRTGCLGPPGCRATPVPYPQGPALVDAEGENVYVVGDYIAAFRRDTVPAALGG